MKADPMSANEHILKLQPKGSNKPIFAIHPVAGHSYCYKLLSRKLGLNQPVYGIENIAFLNKHSDFYSVENLAARYLKDIQSVQSKGPYKIASWCMGSFFAYELCKQIEEQGDSIDMLMLFAPPLQQAIEDEADLGLKAIFSALGMPNFDIKKSDLNNLTPVECVEYVINKLKNENNHHAELGFTESELVEIKRLVKAHLYNIFATEKYPMASQIEKIVLFTTSESVGSTQNFNPINWQNYSKTSLQIHQIHGEDSVMLEEPAVTFLSQKVSLLLKEQVNE